MSTTAAFRIDRFVVPADRAYHRVDHTWARAEGDRVRIGMDELGLETAGDLAQLLLAAPGSRVAAGGEMGSLEAQKFVGALRSPVAGTVAEVNQAALADPRVVAADPYGEGWLVVVVPDEPDPLRELVSGDDIEPWFTAELAEFRRQGSVAE